MSLWGPNPLDNDDAVDWLTELESEPSVVALNAAFDEVLSGDEYLEVDQCAGALCAALMTAALLADEVDDCGLSEPAAHRLRQSFLRLLPSARRGLVSRALRSLQACTDKTRSELFELTHEAQPLGRAWLDAAEALRQRLVDGADDARGQQPDTAARPP
jgi:hypothetical protein